MKTVDIDALPEPFASLLLSRPHERVLLRRGGKPCAILSDVSHLDEEEVGYISDPDFWKMIAERRKRRGGVTLDEAFRRLEAREAGQQR